MIHSAEKVRADFDRIAHLAAAEPDRSTPYEEFLLGQVPAAPCTVLEVGSGTGAFCRALAVSGRRVVGIDLSPEMIQIARSRPPAACDVLFECGDFLEFPFGEQRFDCVVSVAMLHHMPLDAAVTRMVELLRPGGVLIVHDIRADEGVWDRLRMVAAVAARGWARLRHGRLRERAEVRAAWRAHGRGERYLTMREVEAWQRKHLAGARLYRHWQWRYTAVWRKPGES